MKKKIIITLFIINTTFFNAISQNVENVFASLQEKSIVVNYNIINGQSGQTFDIELWYSADDAAYKKCQSIICNSEECNSAGAGFNKSIIWHVLQDMGSLECNTLSFEVRATVNMKTNESVSKISYFTDSRDNRTYKCVQIDNQTIMAENLAYKPTNGIFWTLNNDQSKLEKYGYFYDWKTAQNVCPTGWHLPAKEEFETLLQNYGGTGSYAFNALIPGGKSGFSALFGGIRFYAGNFLLFETFAYFWSSTPGKEGNAFDLYLWNGKALAGIGYYNKDCGFSVRCIRD